MTTTSLPPAFSDLQPYVEAWAVSGLVNRAHRRDISTAAERQAFYDAMRNRVGDILNLLGDKPLTELDAPEQNLLNLALSFGHVALAVEIQGDAEARHTESRVQMKIA